MHERRPAVKEKTMKKPRNDDTDTMRDEYPSELIRSGVRGKYAARFKKGTRAVVLDPDIAGAFPDAKSVNAALRTLVQLADRHTRKAAR